MGGDEIGDLDIYDVENMTNSSVPPQSLTLEDNDTAIHPTPDSSSRIENKQLNRVIYRSRSSSFAERPLVRKRTTLNDDEDSRSLMEVLKLQLTEENQRREDERMERMERQKNIG